MHEEQIKALQEAGIDYQSALERFMNNEALLKRFLLKFLSDSNYAALENALKAGDVDAAFHAAHTLKGVTGNLSMTPLFQALTEQSDFLRNKNLAEACAMQPKVEKLYTTVRDALTALENA